MADNSKPRPSLVFWQNLTRVDKSKINTTWMAARNALAVAVPLAIGIALRNPPAGVAISTGALNVSYSDGRDPYGQRARRMLTWSILGAFAVFVGSITGAYHYAAILVAAAWAFVAGMLISVGTRAGDLGLNTLVILVVFGARGALSPRGALFAGLLALGGGLLQMLFALLLWPIHRYAPERRAVGQAYLDLAKVIDPYSEITASPPLSAPDSRVQETIAALGHDHSIAGERFRLLFDQTDRLRLSVYLLNRLRDGLGEGDNQNSEAEGDAAGRIDELLSTASKLVAAIGECLLEERTAQNVPMLLGQIETILQSAQTEKAEAAFPLVEKIAAAEDVLAGQLRLVAQLSQHFTPEGDREFVQRYHDRPWKLQLASWLATFRANLDVRSAVCRHAIRLAACVAIADAIGRSSSWQRTYWLPMTVAVVLKPDFTTTFNRGVLRLAGTFAGLLLATVLYRILPPSALTQLLLVGVFTALLRKLGPANYGIFSLAISGLIVFLIAATGLTPASVVAARALNTVAGGVLALIAYALWPTWEKTQVSEALADMLDATRLYFQAVAVQFGTDRSASESEMELDRRRRDWRRTRSAAEASVDRVTSEPGITAAKRDCLASILASSHALVYSIMGLEAGLLQTATHTSPAAFQTFALDVEFTLYFLAAALRGSSAANRTLPELRQDHRRMIESRQELAPSDEYVLGETDRLTSSLNTLREQVIRYIGGCS